MPDTRAECMAWRAKAAEEEEGDHQVVVRNFESSCSLIEEKRRRDVMRCMIFGCDKHTVFFFLFF